MKTGIDPQILYAWLAARSIARGLPAPVPEHGGYRVETKSQIEVRRWVFAQINSELIELAASNGAPRHFFKVCAAVDDLAAVLPPGWQLGPPSFFMRGTGVHAELSLAAGYRLQVERNGAVCSVCVFTPSGELAASGYAAETAKAFIYDRIVTAPEHRRKGLGRAVMCSLRRSKSLDVPEFLVATEQGSALYTTLGWETIAPYSSATLAEP